MDGHDIRMINAVVTRPRMYIGNNTDYSVLLVFLSAYEAGSRSRCNFLQLLSNEIKIKYKITVPAEGLIKQLKLASDYNELNLEDFMKFESLALLHRYSDVENGNLFVNDIRRQILESTKSYKKDRYINRWPNLMRLCHESDEWIGSKLSDPEYTSIKCLQSSVDAEAEIQNLTDVKLNLKLLNLITNLEIEVKRKL